MANRKTAPFFFNNCVKCFMAGLRVRPSWHVMYGRLFQLRNPGTVFQTLLLLINMVQQTKPGKPAFLVHVFITRWQYRSRTYFYRGVVYLNKMPWIDQLTYVFFIFRGWLLNQKVCHWRLRTDERRIRKTFYLCATHNEKPSF